MVTQRLATLENVNAAVAAIPATWFTGAQRQEVSAQVPGGATLQEQHRLTIPAGVNKMIGVKISALAVDNQVGPGFSGGIQEYHGTAARDSAGVLVSFPGSNLFGGPMAGFNVPPSFTGLGIETGMGMVVDGDDLVINVISATNPGTIRSLVEWVIVDSPTPIT